MFRFYLDKKGVFMDLTVNGFSQSFGIKMRSYVSNLKAAVNISVKDYSTGIIYNVLPKKPEYMYASEKKIIQYPVLVNGVETVYNVKYPYSQNHINRIGGEMAQKKGLDLQLISVREIARDIVKKAQKAQKANPVETDKVRTLTVG